MSDSYKEREANIAKALDAFAKNTYLTAAACAREFNISPRLFQRRLHGHTKRKAVNMRLSTAQELALKEYIEFLDNIELSIRLPLIRGAANHLLQLQYSSSSTLAPRVGKCWTGRFMKRNPQFFMKKGKPLAAERKNAHNVVDIQAYFSQFHSVTETLGIPPDDMWNMDETGFRVGCGVAHLVVTLSPHKRVVIADPDNRDYITAVECINGVGGSVPSFLILKGVNILHKWALENELEDDIMLATSDSGYSNDSLALDWLKHFNTHSKKSQIGRYRLLLLDGYGSHLTYEFWEYAKENRICLFRLPPHSTHLTQPLDVGVFQPMKHYHAEAVDNAIRMGDVDFGRLDFLAAFNQFRTKAFKPSTIKSAWQKTGLIPYNPEMVLTKIRALNPPKLHSPLPTPSFSETITLPHTPKKAKDVAKEGQDIIQRMNNDEEITPERMRRFIKGSVANANLLELTQRDLQATHAAALAKTARKKLGGTVVQEGGFVSIKDVRHNHLHRTQEELDREESRQKRAETARQKKLFLHGKAIARRFGLMGKKAESWMNERQQLILNSFILKESINELIVDS